MGRPPDSPSKSFAMQSNRAKKLPTARRANQRFHVVEVAVERPPTRAGDPEARLRNTSLEGLLAGDVARLLELPCVDAQIAVGRSEQALQLVESEPLVDRERADHSEPDPFVDQAVQTLWCRRSRRGCGEWCEPPDSTGVFGLWSLVFGFRLSHRASARSRSRRARANPRSRERAGHPPRRRARTARRRRAR